MLRQEGGPLERLEVGNAVFWHGALVFSINSASQPVAGCEPRGGMYACGAGLHGKGSASDRDSTWARRVGEGVNGVPMSIERIDDDAATALVLALLVLLGALCCYLHVRKPRCVVVADDFGISMERNRGIIRALKSGVVTSTSVMANGDAAVEAIEMARANGLLGVVGLHLNLTEGRPLSQPQDIPSLLLQRGETHQPGTGLKGGTLLRGKMGYRKACGSGEVKAAEAATEARAQLAWFEKHVGCMPRFVDGHQHCHVVSVVREALAAVFAAAGVRVTRVPKERKPSRSLCPLCSIVDLEAEEARAVFEAHGVSSCEGFVGLSLCGVDYSADDLLHAVRTQMEHGARSCEVMVHPGEAHMKGTPWDDFSGSAARQHELDVLTSTGLRRRLRRLVRLQPHR